MTAIAALAQGGKRALAKAIAQMEASPDSSEVALLLDCAFASPRGFSLGLTGPPGVGKSTLLNEVIREWRRQAKTVGVIAVDPSSAFSGGALLGDRTRLTTDPGDTGTFVRSMAARNRLGGLADISFPTMILMRALFDLVILETVGVGQSETEISNSADVVAFCAQPGSGDAIQFMKAGVIEVPDIILVTKSDLGSLATRTVSDLKGALSLSADGRTVPVVPVSAANQIGVEESLHEICKLAAQKMPRFADLRNQQIKHWLNHQIRERFGSEGAKLLHNRFVDKLVDSPFQNSLLQIESLSIAMTEAFQ